MARCRVRGSAKARPAPQIQSRFIKFQTLKDVSSLNELYLGFFHQDPWIILWENGEKDEHQKKKNPGSAPFIQNLTKSKSKFFPDSYCVFLPSFMEIHRVVFV